MTSAKPCWRMRASVGSPSSVWMDGRRVPGELHTRRRGGCLSQRSPHEDARRGPVAFECDGIDRVYHTGWSVLATGNAEEVVNEAELARLARLPLDPWCPGPKSTWVRIRPLMLTGRRIPPPGQTRTDGS